MTYEEGQLVGLKNEPNKAGIFIGNEMDGCQQVDFLGEDGEFHREYVKKDKICTLEWSNLNEQARQKIRKRVSILNMGYESGSWNFMYLRIQKMEKEEISFNENLNLPKKSYVCLVWKKRMQRN